MEVASSAESVMHKNPVCVCECVFVCVSVCVRVRLSDRLHPELKKLSHPARNPLKHKSHW